MDNTLHDCIWVFPKIRGTIFGGPHNKIIVYWGLYLGPLILGNYHIPKLLSRNYDEVADLRSFRFVPLTVNAL